MDGQRGSHRFHALLWQGAVPVGRCQSCPWAGAEAARGADPLPDAKVVSEWPWEEEQLGVAAGWASQLGCAGAPGPSWAKTGSGCGLGSWSLWADARADARPAGSWLERLEVVGVQGLQSCQLPSPPSLIKHSQRSGELLLLPGLHTVPTGRLQSILDLQLLARGAQDDTTLIGHPGICPWVCRYGTPSSASLVRVQSPQEVWEPWQVAASAPAHVMPSDCRMEGGQWPLADPVAHLVQEGSQCLCGSFQLANWPKGLCVTLAWHGGCWQRAAQPNGCVGTRCSVRSSTVE